MQNRTFKTNRTFIGHAAEKLDEHNNLASSDYQNIVYTNRSSISDMKVMKGTQQIFFNAGHKQKMNDDAHKLDVAKYSCACSQCRSYGDVSRCLYYNDRMVKTACVKEKI